MSGALLIELFTEELPPKALKKLGASFEQSIVAGLLKRNLVALPTETKAVQSQGFATPRRLAVRVEQVLEQAADQTLKVKGPSTKVGQDSDGKPTQALVKWAEKQGVSVDSLWVQNDGKQDCYFAQTQLKGSALAGEIQTLIEESLAALPIPKFMSYQLADGVTTVSFVRPAHRLCVLYTDSTSTKVLPCQILGLSANNLTEGHRFHSSGSFAISTCHTYEKQLRAASVVANYDERANLIGQLLLQAAAKENARLSDKPGRDDATALKEELLPFLEEVASLVESANVYVGQFEEQFLKVPQECLILTMRTNQKYFPLFNKEGQLLNRFLVVSNINTTDPSQIIDGNQRVIRPRLADAKFFFEQDKKVTLASRIEGLGQVVYHAKLGTQADRMQRVQTLASAIASQIGAPSAWANRSAQLAKCDLLSNMVGEFPELQGIMGRYYAQNDAEPAEVAQALAEQYLPRFAGDELPSTQTGTALALADKLETLCGIWGVGQQPTGDRDPFALRRHALGIVRMLLEKQLPLNLQQLIETGFGAFAAVAQFKSDAPAVLAFVVDRLRGLLKDRGYENTVIEAVLAGDANNLSNLIARLDAVKTFASHASAPNLAAANKRIGNILKKSADGQVIAHEINIGLLVEPAEQALAKSLLALEPGVNALYQQGQFESALLQLAQLRAPVDEFFEKVMVMADDPAVRSNRLALLAKLHRLMNQGADLARLAS